MSNNQYLIEYQKLYSKYVEQLMIVHNYHDNFVKYIGLESSRKIRIALMEMIKLEKEMRVACREAYKENNRVLKESRKKPRAGCTLPGKRGSGRRKKIRTGNNDNATNQ